MNSSQIAAVELAIGTRSAFLPDWPRKSGDCRNFDRSDLKAIPADLTSHLISPQFTKLMLRIHHANHYA
jgi:hypothetical protein